MSMKPLFSQADHSELVILSRLLDYVHERLGALDKRSAQEHVAAALSEITRDQLAERYGRAHEDVAAEALAELLRVGEPGGGT